MTSEIRANAIKNRVGLGTVSYTNTGIVVSGIVTANSFSGPMSGSTGTFSGNVDINADLDVDGHTNLDNVSVAGFSTFTGSIDVVSTDSGAAAAPILDLIRNSSSAADNDLLGQLRFSGKDDQGSAETYAYITGKILDASAGGEDGILEFTHRKNSAFVITGRWRSDSLQLLNGTNFSVAGDTTLTGDLDVDGHTNLDNVSIAGVTTVSDNFIFDNGTNAGKDLQWQPSNNRLAFFDDVKATFGNNVDLQLYHSPNNAFIVNNTGTLNIQSDTLRLTDTGLAHLYLKGTASATELYHDNNVRLTTTDDGITVDKGVTINGIEGGDAQIRLRADQGDDNNDMFRFVVSDGGTGLHIQGYDGSFQSRISVATNGNVDINADLDVDGHTNLDNVSVAGVTTFTGNANFGSNGLISSAANFALSSNKLRVTGSDTVGIECQRASNATIQCTETTNNTDLQLRANSEGGLVRTATQKPLVFGTYQQERLRITSDGKFLFNDSTITATYGGYFHITNTNVAINSFANNPHAQTFMFAKSRGTTGSGGTIVQDNDFCGHIEWYADDGVDTANQIAKISGRIDGTVGTDVTPGELTFHTTAASANVSTERLRITSGGDFGTNGVTPTTQSGRVFHLHAGNAQQRLHMTNSTTGTSATDGFEILIDQETNTNCRIRNFEAGYMAFDTGGANNEVMRLTSGGDVVIGHTAANAKLQVNSGTSSAVGDATNPAFQIGSTANYRFAIHTTNEEAIIANKNGDDGISFHTKSANGGSFGAALRIHSTGGIQISNTGNVSPFTPTTSGITGGLVFTTPVYSEYHYTWSGHSSYTIDLTCASYFHSEFIYVQHQTNGGSRMQKYVRGQWSNNHTQHSCKIWEDAGSGGGLSVSFIASDQSGGGSINGQSNRSSNGSTYSGFVNGGGENNSSTANGRLRISETYVWGSVSTRGLIVRVYFGSFAISKS